MPEITILPPNTDKKPIELRKEWNDIAEANARLIKEKRTAQRLSKPMPAGKEQENPVPWVQMGNLFLSLFETGENSWKPLVTNLAADQQSAGLFTIMTGRHGSAVQHTISSGQFTGVKDSSHLTEDLKKVSELKGKLPSTVDMMVLDVTDPDFNSERRLRSCIRQHLTASRCVILAWCFSIFALKGVPEDSTSDDIDRLHPGLLKMSIRRIIKDDWSPV